MLRQVTTYMASAGPKRRLKWVVLFMLAWLVVGLSLPLLSTLTQNDVALKAVTTSSQAADLAGGYLITAPVSLSHQPRISLERGTLHGMDAKGRAMTGGGISGGEASKIQLASGAVVVSDGEIRISAGAAGLDAAIESATGAFVHPVLGQLARQTFTTLTLRRTTLLITLPDGETEAVRDVTGELKRGRNTWQFKGEGLMMGQLTALDFTLGAVSTERRANAGTNAVALAPLKFAIKNKLLDWTFDGRIGLTKALHLVGTTDVDLTVARQLPWLSRLLPDSLNPAGGKPLAQNLKAKGALDWSANSMALSGAKLEIDGNEATGALSIDRRPKRPVLSGTLAFQTLDLTRHMPHPASGTTGEAKPSAMGAGAGHLTAMALTLLQSWGPADRHMPLIALMDADLRVSSDKLVLGPVTLRRTAATVSNHGGKLLADVAAFEFDGGRGTGQISGDFTGPMMQVGLRGRLDNLDAVRATTALFGTPFIEGKGIVTVDLTGAGASLNDVVQNAKGRVTTVIPDGGRMAVDLRGLAAASQKRAVEGWSAGGRDQMSFDGLDAVFALANGVLKAEDTSQARVRDDLIKLTGTIDMPSSRLNLTAVGPFIGFSGQTPSSLQIFGPWARPTVRLDVPRKAASAAPTTTSPKP
jgi:uncharacterized protein involved in outer membrane biogenesis